MGNHPAFLFPGGKQGTARRNRDTRGKETDSSLFGGIQRPGDSRTSREQKQNSTGYKNDEERHQPPFLLSHGKLEEFFDKAEHLV